MNLKVLMLVVVACGILAGRSLTAAEPRTPEQPTTRPTSQPALSNELTVAILDFNVRTPGAPDLGGQIGEALTAILSGEPGFRLVDRSTLTRVLQEHELNLTGVVETEKAVQIGKLVGARILITGRAFPLGKQQMITGKIIGTETSLVDGVLVKGAENADTADLVVQLSEQLAKRLRDVGPKLVAQPDTATDPLPALRARLAGLKLPRIAVIVTESHIASRSAPPPVDPAVETEIKKLLRECGFDIVDVEQNDLADWARLLNKNDVGAWPRSLASADVVITGEGFSEFAARIGNLVSCSARAEINVIRRSDGRIALADRETTRAVDLSENIAGKKALEKAGRTLGTRVLEYFAKPAATQPTEVKP